MPGMTKLLIPVLAGYGKKLRQAGRPVPRARQRADSPLWDRRPRLSLPGPAAFFRIVLGFAALISNASGAGLSVRLLPSMASPQPVGTVIGLFPRVENAATGMQVFRYSVSVDGGPLHVVRDFSQQKEFVWRPQLYEHGATVRVTVRNNVNKETAEAELPFRIVSRIKGSLPVVTPTSHPLI